MYLTDGWQQRDWVISAKSAQILEQEKQIAPELTCTCVTVQSSGSIPDASVELTGGRCRTRRNSEESIESTDRCHTWKGKTDRTKLNVISICMYIYLHVCAHVPNFPLVVSVVTQRNAGVMWNWRNGEHPVTISSPATLAGSMTELVRCHRD